VYNVFLERPAMASYVVLDRPVAASNVNRPVAVSNVVLDRPVAASNVLHGV
jgi:hypothetical protein